MKTTSFENILKKHFSHEEIKEIEYAARLEFEILSSLQKEISENLSSFMEEESYTLSEVARKLGTSISQVQKIQQGKANLTISSIAHLYALMRKKPFVHPQKTSE